MNYLHHVISIYSIGDVDNVDDNVDVMHRMEHSPPIYLEKMKKIMLKMKS